MTPEDHKKICMKGLIIIRRFDKPRPHIKEKTPENPDKWVEHDGNYTSVQVRDNVADYLLATNLYVEDPLPTKDEVKQQAISILQDIIGFWDPIHGEAILTEFENRLNEV